MRQEQDIANSEVARPMYGGTPFPTRYLKADATSRFGRTGRRRRTVASAAVALLLVAGACAGSPDGRPPGETTSLPPDTARLGFALPGFANASGSHSRYSSEDRRYSEEFAEWRLEDGTTSGLSLSAAQTGAPFTDPGQPADVLSIWPQFKGKRPVFGNLATMQNDLGEASYQRVAVGTWACVVFVQRWLSPDPRIAADAQAATLSGFYCNPQGVLLTPDEALSVLRSVVLNPPRVQS